jgi:hypothetical protein
MWSLSGGFTTRSWVARWQWRTEVRRYEVETDGDYGKLIFAFEDEIGDG